MPVPLILVGRDTVWERKADCYIERKEVGGGKEREVIKREGSFSHLKIPQWTVTRNRDCKVR